MVPPSSSSAPSAAANTCRPCSRAQASWWRGGRDSRSDVDLIAVAPTRDEADTFADGLLSDCLGDDVIALDAAQWRDRRHSQDPHWRGITEQAIRLVPLDGR